MNTLAPAQAALPNDYLTRVYAGVLGKLIGVYLGRPFEQWTHQRIMRELGPIEYYVHDRLNQPLVVTDDDVAGTFTFLRALEDYGISPDLTAEDIGRAWLNYIIEDRTILWWGGIGNSTEHTAWLNLKKGLSSPASGSIATNGTTVAEQIGAQIFIDGWAMVAPNQPDLAARLAGRAGSVSHDGESVYAAQLWAAMEAEAFRSADINQLIDVGLAQIPSDCLIARLIADIRRWHSENPDWLATRQLIEDTYGYAKFQGNCHVVPNHALMIMAVLYAPDDFQRAQMIVNTSGWDTDCNAGNVGCLMGIMLGLDGIDAGADFRGPIADRLLISSADGGFSINDAVKMAYYIASLGQQLAGGRALAKPKEGAQFHFSLPGSRQGFQPCEGHGLCAPTLANVETAGDCALSVAYRALSPGQTCAAVTTPTFSPREMLKMRTYDLMATPLVTPGQTVHAHVVVPAANRGALNACIRLRVYDAQDRLEDVDGPVVRLEPRGDQVLTWRLPEVDGQPIAEVGIALTAAGPVAEGSVVLDWLGWTGTPDFTLHRPANGSQALGNRYEDGCDFWRMAWVNGASLFSKRFPQDFRMSQNVGEGIILHGTREWTDYKVTAEITLLMGDYGGIVVRGQGLRRYYAARLLRSGAFQIVRRQDEVLTVLAETAFPVALDQPVAISVSIAGTTLTATPNGATLTATDPTYADGAMGLLVHEGALCTNAIHIGPVT